MATNDKIIGGRQYNLGNDYPADIGCRPVEADTWVASSYLDGIYTQATSGFIKDRWNICFNTILPEETWTSAKSGKQFPDQYGVAYLSTQAEHVSAVSAYASDGIDAVIAEGVVDAVDAGESASPYTKKSLDEIMQKG